MTAPGPLMTEPAPDAARYRILLVAVLAVLALIVGALTVGNAVRGPRVVEAAASGARLVDSAGTPVVARLDQAVREVPADAVSVVPETPIEVAVDGADLTVRFAERLRYATDYEVTIADAVGVATGARGDLTLRVSTPDARPHSLVRGSPTGEPDRILRRPLAGGEAQVVYSATRIQEYAVLPGQLAVVEQDDSGGATLRLARIGEDGAAEGEPERISLPDSSTVDQVASSGSSGLLGYVVTADAGATLDNVLHIYDPTDSSGIGTPVTGLDGAPLSVLDWQWVPGTTSLVAQAFDQTLLLADPLAGTPPTPLGAHAEMRDFLPGSTRLVVADPTGGGTIDLASGETRALALPEDGLPDETYRDSVIALDDDEYLQTVSEPSLEFGAVDYRVLRVGPEGARELYAPASPTAGIRDVCPSPNDQFVAVEVVSPEGTTDDYPTVPSFTAISTVVVDMESGDASRGLPGFAVDWCG